MGKKRLSPSEIRYTQDSIGNRFCDGGLIGEVLDDLYHRRYPKRAIPKIEVALVNGKWYTADNRRLWVFRNLEKLGMCRRIPVYLIDAIPPKKWTTQNDGADVIVRGHPGGECINELNQSRHSDHNIPDELYKRLENFSIHYH